MRNVTEVVKQLIIVNILFFIGTYLLGDVVYKVLALFFPENPNFQYWQLLSHMFMHGGVMHIFFNMFALYSFGSALEQIWGGKKFLFFYISCGLGAALLHTGVNYYYFNDAITTLTANGFNKQDILQLLNEGKIDTRWQQFINASDFSNFTSAYAGTAVGASGAIYGIIVAFAFMFPNAELALMFIPVPIKAKYFVPGLVLVDLYLGISGKSIFGGGGIAHFAHVGGALFGFLMMWYWKKNQFNKNRWN
ncbi:rhomboid family intramembrane serine protease [Flavobacterium sp. CHNK8]|uniref:rhomboid family intramembrane serine protease n=1 Tax=Flavobacterium sp. CHNK8 TaxID=2871165 RepID=UPI001C8EDFE1|nr:rhomboid family intramembrane serine protease [Flavobacterium sp. CHNK8]QZK89746.1 rhomboid family intramembrane serine protease [Flavobacterium sp. CHNK8]